jgi:hypothetical protein
MLALIGHEFVPSGVDDDNSRCHDDGLLELTLIAVPEHPRLLVHDVNPRPTSEASLVPSASTSVALIVHVHNWVVPIESDARFDPANVPSLVADTSHVVPTTHVNDADADVTPTAITANTTANPNKLHFNRPFITTPNLPRWIRNRKVVNRRSEARGHARRRIGGFADQACPGGSPT